jgi:hypothetical protein
MSLYILIFMSYMNVTVVTIMHVGTTSTSVCCISGYKFVVKVAQGLVLLLCVQFSIFYFIIILQLIKVKMIDSY